MSYENRVLLKHSLASVVALGLTGLARFLYSILVARWFGPEELGAANSLISKAFFLAIPLSFFAVALGKYSSEFLGRNKNEDIKSLTLPSFALPLAGLLIVPINVYLGLIATLRAFQLTLRSFLYGIHRGEHYAYIMLASFLGFLCGFVFMFSIFSPYILFLSASATLGLGYLIRFELLGMPTREGFRLLTSYSAFAFLGTLSGVFLIQGPYFMSEYLGGTVTAGEVSAVLSTAFLLTYLPQVLQSAVMPILSYKYGQGSKGYIKKLAEKTTEFLILITGLVVFLMMLLGNDFLSFLFSFRIGNSFYLALMAIEIYIAYNPSIVALNSTAYVRYGTLVSGAGALAGALLWAILIPRFQSLGAMVGLLAAYGIILIGTATLSKRLLNLNPGIYTPLLLALLLQASAFTSKYLLAAAFLVFLYTQRKTIKEVIKVFRAFRGRVL